MNPMMSGVGHYVYVVDQRTGKRYGGGSFPLGVPRIGEHVLTGEPRGRDVTEPKQWVRVTAVSWETGRQHVTLYVLPEPLPLTWRPEQGADGT